MFFVFDSNSYIKFVFKLYCRPINGQDGQGECVQENVIGCIQRLYMTYTYIQTYTYTHTYIHEHTHTNTNINTYITYKHTYIHTYIHTNIYIHTYIYT